jgi:hypothetical protein
MKFKEKLKILFDKKTKKDFFNKLFILFLANDKIYNILMLALFLNIFLLITYKIFEYNRLFYMFYILSLILASITIITSIFYKIKNKVYIIHYNKSDINCKYYINIKLKFNEIVLKIYMFDDYNYFLLYYNIIEYYKMFERINNINYCDIIYIIKDNINYKDLDDWNVKKIKYIIKKSILYKRKLKLKNID